MCPPPQRARHVSAMAVLGTCTKHCSSSNVLALAACGWIGNLRIAHCFTAIDLRPPTLDAQHGAARAYRAYDVRTSRGVYCLCRSHCTIGGGGAKPGILRRMHRHPPFRWHAAVRRALRRERYRYRVLPRHMHGSPAFCNGAAAVQRRGILRSA